MQTAESARDITQPSAFATWLARGLKAATGQLPWLALAILAGSLVLWPLYQLQARAFANGFEGYRELASLPGLLNILLITVLLGTVSVAMALVLGVLLALAMSRLPRGWRRILGFVPLITIITPGVAIVMGWIFLFSPVAGYANVLLRATGLFHGHAGPVDAFTVTFILIYTGSALTAYVFIFVDASLQNLGPEYEAAALVAGASPLRAFIEVVLPLLRPALLYAAGTILLLGLSQFAAPLLLGQNEGINVLTTEIYLLTQNYPINYAMGAALGSPLLVVGIGIILMTRLLLGEPNRFVVSHVGEPWSFHRRGAVLISGSFVVIYGLVTAVLPLLAVTYVALTPYWSGKLSLARITGQNFTYVLTQPQLTTAITTSLQAAALSMIIVLALGLGISLASLTTSRASRVVRLVLEFVALVPLAVPAALIGFAILFSYSGQPFMLYGTFWILVVAYVTIMLPYASRITSAALASIGPSVIEASRVCGANAIQTFAYVIAPLIRPAVAGAGALIVILLFQEFGASLMVTNPSQWVMGTVLYGLWVTGIYPQVAVMALMMLVVTVAAMAIARSVVNLSPFSIWRRMWHRS